MPKGHAVPASPRGAPIAAQYQSCSKAIRSAAGTTLLEG
jgi:hypothetical protein